jgi:3-oxoacyl-[acyl-carrier protein] reductase
MGCAPLASVTRSWIRRDGEAPTLTPRKRPFQPGRPRTIRTPDIGSNARAPEVYALTTPANVAAMSEGLFERRVALVTGGSGGIGTELCIRLAGGGAAVAVHYSSGKERADGVVRRIEESGGRAVALEADLSHPAAPEQLIDAVERDLGPVDLLMANAGLARPGSYEDVDAAAFDETLAVNLRAPYLLARRLLPGMRARGWGRILFTSSVAALTGGIVGPHYASSKAGLHGLTHFLAARAAGDGVTVNAIAPALIEETGMLPGDPGDLARRIPVGRLGTPAEVADLALAVVSNGYVTNQVIGIDGGIHPR